MNQLEEQLVRAFELGAEIEAAKHDLSHMVRRSERQHYSWDDFGRKLDEIAGAFTELRTMGMPREFIANQVELVDEWPWNEAVGEWDYGYDGDPTEIEFPRTVRGLLPELHKQSESDAETNKGAC